MRNKWFPHSLGGAFDTVSTCPRVTTASDQFELHMGPGIRLKDEKDEKDEEDSDVGVGSKSEIVLVSKPQMVAVHMV